MVAVTECPACGGNQFTPFLDCADHSVSHETFQIIQCERCKLCATSPRPDSNEISRYYNSEEYISHTGKSSGLVGWLYLRVRRLTLKWKRSLVEKSKSPGEILDFGCGTGEFLSVMKKNQWTVTGVEPSGNARARAEEKTGEKIYSSLSELSQTPHDVITLWHVLEHVSDLRSTLTQLKGLLKKDGIIFIAVPNYESPDAGQYKNFWAGYDVPRHLWHFSKESMSRLITRNGFRLIGTKPMMLDSFYVSLLSEKYRNGSGIKSLWNGFVSGVSSNSRASESKNHSSLIYIIGPS